MRGAGGRRVWRGEWTDAAGRRRRVLLGARRADAQRRLDHLVRERDLALAGEREECTPGELRGLFLADAAARVSARHLAELERQTGRVLEELGESWRDPAAFVVYRAGRLALGLANATLNRELEAYTAMLRWAVGARLLAENPLAGVSKLQEGPAHEKRPRHALDDGEAARLVAAARGDDRALGRAVPQWWLWSFLLGTGLRWSEACLLEWRDVVGDHLVLRAATTKTRRRRIVPLPVSTAEELEAVRAAHALALRHPARQTDPVWLGPQGAPWRQSQRGGWIRRLFRRHLKLAGIPLEHPDGSACIYSLRHAFAYRMARLGMPLPTLQTIMGHASPTTTARYYAHFGAEELVRARRSLPEICPHSGPSLVQICHESATAHREGRQGASAAGSPKPARLRALRSADRGGEVVRAPGLEPDSDTPAWWDGSADSGGKRFLGHAVAGGKPTWRLATWVGGCNQLPLFCQCLGARGVAA